MPVRVASLMLAAAFAVGGAVGGAATGGSTSLVIKVTPDARKPAAFNRYVLRCAPVGGTLPQPGRACAQLARTAKPFAPIPKDVACTQIYGGPQQTVVIGVYGRKPVRTTFTRTDGCQIARWNRVRFLFPIRVGVT